MIRMQPKAFGVGLVVGIVVFLICVPVLSRDAAAAIGAALGVVAFLRVWRPPTEP